MNLPKQPPNLSDTPKTENEGEYLDAEVSSADKGDSVRRMFSSAAREDRSEISYDELNDQKLEVYQKAVLFISADIESRALAGATTDELIVRVAVEQFLRDEIEKLMTDAN